MKLSKTVFALGATLTAMDVYRAGSRLAKISAADDNFRQSGWGGYQFGLTNLSKLSDTEFDEHVSQSKKLFDEYTFEHSKFITVDNYYKYLEELFKQLPHLIEDARTFIIFVSHSEKIIGTVANHAVCDGIILYKILGIMNNFTDNLVVPKYKRIPIMSEMLVLSYVARMGYKSLKSSVLKEKVESNSTLGDKETINRRFVTLTKLNKMKRFAIYAKVFEMLYAALDPNITTLRFAFTIAWNDSQTHCKNRIGVIVLDVPRLSSIKETEAYLEENLKKNQYDALSSYELVKSYYVPSLRKRMANRVDGVFSAFKINKDIPGYTSGFGGFCGDLSASFYINVMSAENQKPDPLLQISIQTATPFFYEKLLREYDPNVERIDIPIAVNIK